MIIANYIAFVIAVIGGLNWGLVGIFNFNLVVWIFGGFLNGWVIAVYILVLLSVIWLIISAIMSRGMIDLGCPYRKDAERKK